MTTPQQHTFTAEQYAPRAADYVSSAVHAQGADLEQIAALLRDMSGARALDLGCGGGHVSYCAAPHVAEVVAIDVTQAMLDEVGRTAEARGLANIFTERAAAEALPFPASSFDVVLCRFSAHHWCDLDAGLREARRVLKTTGFAIFIDVVAPANPLLDTHLQAVEVLRDPSHVRNYTSAEWAAALARAGLEVQGMTLRKLRMEFDVWTARTATPAIRADAVRSLQTLAPDLVKSHFAIDEAGSFDIQSATFLAAPTRVS